MKTFALFFSCLTLVSAQIVKDSDNSKACKAWDSLMANWAAGDMAKAAATLADKATLTVGKEYAPGTAGLNDFGTRSLNRADAARLLYGIAESFDFYGTIAYDCYGRGNQGMTNYYHVIVNEKAGSEGLLRMDHTHILKTNDAGQLTYVAWHVYRKESIKDVEYHFDRVSDSDGECDVASGEVFHKGSEGVMGGAGTSRKTSLAKCKSTCQNDPQCNSLTFFQSSGYCSHFKTACMNVKKKRHAISLRVRPAPRGPTTAAPKSKKGTHVFEKVGEGMVCSEGFRYRLPQKKSTLENCKKTCLDDPQCNSITFFTKSRYCSHFRKSCMKTKKKNTGISFRLVTCAKTQYIKNNMCAACPSGSTCDGVTATACASTKYVTANVCKACPSGSTCDGTTATACAKTKYVKNNVCTACPSGSTCDGATATACAKTKYVKDNVCTACPSGSVCDGATATATTTTKAAPTTANKFFKVTPKKADEVLAFMIDRSGSMSAIVPGTSKNRYTVTCEHILKLLASRSATTKFSIQMFSSSLYAEFHSGNAVANTPTNFAALKTYLASKGPDGGTNMLAGINGLLAKKGVADTLYLLADGDTGSKTEIIAAAKAGGKPVHVVGVGLAKGSGGYQILADIADASGGTKNFV